MVCGLTYKKIHENFSISLEKINGPIYKYFTFGYCYLKSFIPDIIEARWAMK
ncbi:hypothetical protein CCP3SC5AM1_1030004 [Gammaproteobacteria bacterium]